ncbi:MAG: ATP-dependent RecD-like DNA helicase [Chlamydiales bacterium]|nr:ATP-dependent RecD-like DNA helicase [Chlamydiales bacterium]
MQERGRIYLRRNWDCEQRFFHHFHRLKEQEPSLPIKELHLTESLENEQKEAIFQAARRSLSLICGGPGTGKTFTAATLIRHFLPYLKEVVVAAPTGKAAANLRAPLKGLASVQTLHSLLKKRQLTADLIVVDEASMIDAEMMASLFAAVKQEARLVLIGDKDQLPPVESGHFFADLAADTTLVTELNRCLRAELNTIVEWARAVREGKEIPVQPLPPFDQLISWVLEEGVCILTPLRHGPWGVERLNQRVLKEHRKRGGTRFPIMIKVNDSAVDLYNGDLGEFVPSEKKAYFGEREVPEYLLPHYEYAYVLSVHKSQGSEYDAVAVLLPEGADVFGREMLYTALTRAKKRVEVYAAEGMLAPILAKREHRHSGFGLER